MLEGTAEEGHLSASASSAHVFLAKNLWWHRGAAFHPQHVFRARRKQHRRGFETPAHNLKLSDTARGSRKAAADKGNESCAIAIQNCVTIGPVQQGGPGSLPLISLPVELQGLEGKIRLEGLTQCLFQGEIRKLCLQKHWATPALGHKNMWLWVVTKRLCPTDLLAFTSDLAKPVPQSPLINRDLD